MTSQPPLATERVRIASLGGIDRATLHRIIQTDVPPGSWRGIGPESTTEAIDGALANGILCQMALVETEADRFIGLVQLGLANFVHGTAQLTVFLRSSYVGRFWPLEGVALFLNWVFHRYPLRKIYAEVPELNDLDFGRGLGMMFDREGCLSAHEWHNGSYRSVVFYSITRDRLSSDRVMRAILKNGLNEPDAVS